MRPGDDLTLLVLEVSPEERKVSLSLKRLRLTWRGVEDRYSAGQMVDAIITNVVNFGGLLAWKKAWRAWCTSRSWRKAASCTRGT